jgi:DNA-binding Lrp family transcriptional regulator
MKLDEVDLKILKLLLKDGRSSLKDLADIAKVSIPTARSRVKHLMEKKIIKNFSAVIDFSKISNSVTAFLGLKAKITDIQHVIKSLNEINEVKDIYLTTGHYDIILIVILPSIQSMDKLILDKLGKINGLDLIQSSFIIDSIKDNSSIPLELILGFDIEYHK